MAVIVTFFGLCLYLFYWPRGPVLFHRNPKRCAILPFRVAETQGAKSFLRSFGNLAKIGNIVDFGSDMCR